MAAAVAAVAATESRITCPKTGDKIVPGRDVMVIWEYGSLPSGQQAPETVDIELRDAATGAPVRTIVSKVPNRGYYFWNVDTNLPIGVGRCLFIGSLLRPSVPSVQSGAFDIVSTANATMPQAPSSVRNSLAGNKRAAVSLHGNAYTSAGNPGGLSGRLGSNSAAPGAVSAAAAWSYSSDNNEEGSIAIDCAATAMGEMSLDETQSGGTGGDSMPPPQQARQRRQQQQRNFSATHAGGGALSLRNTKRRRDASDSSRSSVSQNQQQKLPQGSFPWCDHPEFVYFTSNMDTVTVRQSLHAVVKENDMTADTMLESGETAGMFCVRYLLMHYYRKRVKCENAAAGEAIRANTFVPDAALQRRYADLLASKSLTAARKIPGRAAARAARQRLHQQHQQQQQKHTQNIQQPSASFSSTRSNQANVPQQVQRTHVLVPPASVAPSPLRLQAPSSLRRGPISGAK